MQKEGGRKGGEGAREGGLAYPQAIDVGAEILFTAFAFLDPAGAEVAVAVGGVGVNAWRETRGRERGREGGREGGKSIDTAIGKREGGREGRRGPAYPK